MFVDAAPSLSALGGSSAGGGLRMGHCGIAESLKLLGCGYVFQYALTKHLGMVLLFPLVIVVMHVMVHMTVKHASRNGATCVNKVGELQD